MMPTEPRSIHPQRVHSVIIPINLPSLARAERTSVPRKNSPSDHASACIRRARPPRFNEFSAVPNQRSVGAKLHLAATRNTSPAYAEARSRSPLRFDPKNPLGRMGPACQTNI